MTDDAAAIVPPDAVETDYEIGQDNIKPFGLDIHNPVFLISGLAIVAFVIITLMFKESAKDVFEGMRNWLTSKLGWFFL
ncbi:MAG TPA: BCCT family transporter, partial [Afifellaceae bacterium]|nr:BCCT family transporter [Afifellaceae bacterium]